MEQPNPTFPVRGRQINVKCKESPPKRESLEARRHNVMLEVKIFRARCFCKPNLDRALTYRDVYSLLYAPAKPDFDTTDLVIF
jgi:hypothetical protein